MQNRQLNLLNGVFSASSLFFKPIAYYYRENRFIMRYHLLPCTQLILVWGKGSPVQTTNDYS